MDISPIQVDADSLYRYVKLFRQCFPATSHFSLQYLEWLYAGNPCGAAVGFDAMENGELVAHYACIPARVRLHRQQVLGLLSLNTATHPAYQGKGLFTRLASATFDEATTQGFACVYGVANANSTPGFVRKLAFQNVVSLEARVGMGGLPASTRRTVCQDEFAFRGIWDEERLRWRLGNPSNPARAKLLAKGLLAIDAPTGRFGLRAYGEVLGETRFESLRTPLPVTPRLVLGLLPSGSSFGSYFPIPKALRPSPLNLIYRPLSGTVRSLEAANVYFTFLDFDAY